LPTVASSEQSRIVDSIAMRPSSPSIRANASGLARILDAAFPVGSPNA
jgi:hypothetical protein